MTIVPGRIQQADQELALYNNHTKKLITCQSYEWGQYSERLADPNWELGIVFLVTWLIYEDRFNIAAVPGYASVCYTMNGTILRLDEIPDKIRPAAVSTIKRMGPKKLNQFAKRYIVRN